MLASAAPTPHPRETTIFFFEGERAGLTKRRSPLAGYWALLVGGALIAVLTVALRPITDVRDCPNYGGSGNASAFPDEIWDLGYPLLLLGWLLSVVVEQLLPVTWNGREAGLIVVRALSAFMIAVIVSCGAAFKLLLLCH
ncbi:hypothetical protein ACFQFC_10535 [Amorphoplanes digitatis]|uniref:Uncharacterized protein n=1 Tax=Actinoplanes digitatis TaxID=1868 RepID=A0A7W7I1F4_9ACTN|nr:hypothetical protein [Actinoplanes digitatis]MBB4764634.1 hypothetical protein [Actinoplanes digitatis]BFE74159.1 hypothetical protein GCM10020092_074600 [Actinoplanes digitatis]GID91416.1 hypothetical protein Adi01nite_08280 [Actinoplanes digitatis]